MVREKFRKEAAPVGEVEFDAAGTLFKHSLGCGETHEVVEGKVACTACADALGVNPAADSPPDHAHGDHVHAHAHEGDHLHEGDEDGAPVYPEPASEESAPEAAQGEETAPNEPGAEPHPEG